MRDKHFPFVTNKPVLVDGMRPLVVKAPNPLLEFEVQKKRCHKFILKTTKVTIKSLS